VKANGCKEEPVTTKLPKKVQDGTAVEIKTYGGGKDSRFSFKVVMAISSQNGKRLGSTFGARVASHFSPVSRSETSTVSRAVANRPVSLSAAASSTAVTNEQGITLLWTT
ncbi:MAG: hypothetical protein ACRDHZ_12170, partial [Ktedonobacteraceae bacterium]